MELMEGCDMHQYLNNKRLGPPSNIRTVQKIGRQLISAIKYLHQNKIIHQDLKPSNIMFSKDLKTVKIIDMGLSK